MNRLFQWLAARLTSLSPQLGATLFVVNDDADSAQHPAQHPAHEHPQSQPQSQSQDQPHSQSHSQFQSQSQNDRQNPHQTSLPSQPPNSTLARLLSSRPRLAALYAFLQRNQSMIVGMAIFASAMTLVDTVFLASESSLLHRFSIGLTSIIKITLIATFAGIFSSLFPARPKETVVSSVPPSETFIQGAKSLLRSAVLILGLSWMFTFFELIQADRSESIMSLFVASFTALGMVALLVKEFQWLDAMIAIRRTEMTGKFRTSAMILIGLVVVAQLLSGIIGFDNRGVVVALMLVLAVVFLLTIVRLPWLGTFSKEQKWRALGYATLIIFTNALLVFNGSGSDSNNAASDNFGLHSFKQVELLVPGLWDIITITAMLSGALFLHVAILVVLALPTATIMDRKISEVRSLSYLSRTISQVYDLDRLLGIVTTMIQDVCGATSSWIELYDDDDETSNTPTTAIKHTSNTPNTRTTRTTRIASQLKISPQQLQMLYKDGILRSVIDAQPRTNLQAISFEALEEEYAFASVYPYTTDFAQSLIAVPLMLDGQRIGTIFAAHRDKFAFEFQDTALLSAFANNISIAIENARLFENSLEQERYKREMMLAREMQQKLLPKQLPHFDAFSVAAYASPALEVGGDYYDCVTLKNGLRCLLIGDVSGKGVTAAFYMAELKGVALAVAQESTSPKNLLQRINAALLESVEKGSYMTMTALAIDETQQELIIARAGHTPIALCLADGTANLTTQLLTPKGFGVALVKPHLFDPTLEEIRVAMPEGSCCLVFTDGVNEAVNARNDEFGYDPISAVLQESALAAQIAQIGDAQIGDTRAGESNDEKNNSDDSAHRSPQHSHITSPADMLVGDLVRRVLEFSAGTPQHDDITVLGIVAAKRKA
jgi:phosphoserine phosphatase RsbU/P